MGIIPIITELTPRGDRTTDVYSYLLQNRIVFVDAPIDDDLASNIVAQLIFLDAQKSDADIYMYINSGGGGVESGLSILDMMKFIKCDISTIAIGKAYSMASVLLSSGTPGKRLAFRHASIMIHQVKSLSPYSQAADIIIQARHTEAVNDELLGILARNTGKTIEQIYRDADRDNFFTAREAVEYGLIDAII